MKRARLKRFCTVCGEVYYPRRDSGKYCSPGCRSKAYRERHNVSKSHSDVLIARWRTKNQNVRLVTCVNCDATFFVTGNTAHRLYCSNACKQRAYRARKASGVEAGLEWPVMLPVMRAAR